MHKIFLLEIFFRYKSKIRSKISIKGKKSYFESMHKERKNAVRYKNSAFFSGL